VDAIRKASRDTARFASAQLRAEAHASGWPSHAANSLSVRYDGYGFKVHTGEHSDLVDTLEHGIGGTPSPVIHRVTEGSKSQYSEKFFNDRVHQYLWGAK
jgi:hypothetical protein